MLRARLSQEQKKEVTKGFARIYNIGFRIAACVFIGVLIGRFLDGVFGTGPILLIVFAFMGAGAGFKTIFSGLKPS